MLAVPEVVDGELGFPALAGAFADALQALGPGGCRRRVVALEGFHHLDQHVVPNPLEVHTLFLGLAFPLGGVR